MNTYNLIESKRNALTTAINNIENYYVLCVENNCFSDDLEHKTVDIVKEIEEVMFLLDTKCYTAKSAMNRKPVYDHFLEDAQKLLREMSVAVSKCL
jgi:hypothetical protein